MWKASDVFKPGVRLDYRWRDDIDGEDASLKVPIPGFPYPAPVTNPTSFGGDQLDLTFLARLPLSAGWYVEAAYSRFILTCTDRSLRKFHFSLEVGRLSSKAWSGAKRSLLPRAHGGWPVVEGARLESVYTATYRGFESLLSANFYSSS